MSQNLITSANSDKAERVRSLRPYGRSRYFAAFLICCAFLVAAFAVSAVWMENGGEEWLRGLGMLGGNTEETTKPLTTRPPVTPPATQEPSLDEQTPAIPEGATPVVDADLSAPHLGPYYINNESIRQPSVSSLLALDVSSAWCEEPMVLILHTHTHESYLASGVTYIEGAVGDATYCDDADAGVTAVGRTLAETLNKKGIPAIHCTVMHDEGSLSGSYDRALESIRFYLEQYPSIRYVIDLHRDSVLNTDGEYLRAVTESETGRVAQVMAVVGSDGSGEENARWEGNLALALQLRQKLNAILPALCRPPVLRNETYNQEVAPYTLLLEIGTGGNSVEEAQRAAVLVGEALAELLLGQ